MDALFTDVYVPVPTASQTRRDATGGKTLCGAASGVAERRGDHRARLILHLAQVLLAAE